MTTNAGLDLCRVTIIGPSRRVDLALPMAVPLAELLPQLLRQSGETAQTPEDAHAGWVLQRLGGPPLDATRRLSALQVRDGEVLYLRPREQSAPEVAFDDLVDAIATSAGAQRQWTSDTTRVACGSVALVGLVVAVAIALSAGPPWVVPAITLLGVGVLAALVATVLARVLDRPRLGGAVGLAAVGATALGGLVLPGGDLGLLELGAPHLLAAGACATAMAVLVLAGTNARTHELGVLAALGVIAVAAAVSRIWLAPSAVDVAAVLVAVILALTPLIPNLGFRSARLRLPLLPRGVVDLTAEDDLPGPDVLQQATTAARVMRDLLIVTAVVVATCSAFLAFASGWAGPTLAALAAAALLLRTRLFSGVAARAALLSGGVGSAALVLVGQFFDRYGADGSAAADDLVRTLVGVAIAIIAAGLLIAYAGRRADRRPGPWAGRLADLVEVLVVLAVVPVVLAVLDLYSWVRGLAG